MGTVVEQEDTTDYYDIFKNKIEDAIRFIPNISNERKLEAWKFWEQISITVKLSINLGNSFLTDQSQQTETSSLPGGSCKACIRKMQALSKPKKSKKKSEEPNNVVYHDENQEAVTSIIVSEPQNPFAFFEKSAVMEYTVNESSPTILLGAMNVEDVSMVNNTCIVDGVTMVSMDTPTEVFETLVTSETEPTEVVTIMPNEVVEMNKDNFEYPIVATVMDDAVSNNATDEQLQSYNLNSDNNVNNVAQDGKMYCPGQTICITGENLSPEKGKEKKISRRKKSQNKENVDIIFETDDQDEEFFEVSEFAKDQTDRKSVRRSVRKKHINRRYRIHDYCNIDSDEEIVEEDDDGKLNDVSFRRLRKGTKTNKKRTNEVPNLTCDHCGLVLSNVGALNVHIRKHSGDRPFVCSVCSKAFVTKGNMQRHEKTHTGVKPFQCETCKKCFTEKKSLKVHMRSHTGEKPFKCPVCDKSFAQSGILHSHIHLHTGHKGHLCDYCGKAFRQKTQLILHQKRHFNNRSFKCGTCNFSFFTKGDLDRHSMKHTGEKPFMCTLCPKTFTRSQYLKEHMNMHTGNKPYVCQKCEDVAFYDMSTYHRHMRKHKIQENAKKTEDGEGGETNSNEVALKTDGEAVEQISVVQDSDMKEECEKQVVVINETEQDFMGQGTIIVSTDVSRQVFINNGPNGNGEQDLSQAEVYHISLDPNNLTSEQVQQVIAQMDFSAINLLATATTT